MLRLLYDFIIIAIPTLVGLLGLPEGFPVSELTVVIAAFVAMIFKQPYIVASAIYGISPGRIYFSKLTVKSLIRLEKHI